MAWNPPIRSRSSLRNRASSPLRTPRRPPSALPDVDGAKSVATPSPSKRPAKVEPRSIQTSDQAYAGSVSGAEMRGRYSRSTRISASLTNSRECRAARPDRSNAHLLVGRSRTALDNAHVGKFAKDGDSGIAEGADAAEQLNTSPWSFICEAMASRNPASSPLHRLENGFHRERMRRRGTFCAPSRKPQARGDGEYLIARRDGTGDLENHGFVDHNASAAVITARSATPPATRAAPIQRSASTRSLSTRRARTVSKRSSRR